MRVRVKVDVRQPLKKDTKVKDREGNWCTVNFKYEKLGVFCFVCGIMGHAENKCVVRFSMETDDGRREWSGELRADQRRGGGRQTSRWLRDERDGGDGIAGGGRRSHGGAATEFPNTGPTTADVSHTVSNQPHHIHAALISNNVASIPLLNSNVYQGESIANQLAFPIIQPITDKNIQASRQNSMHTETEKTQQSLDNQFSQFSKTDLCSLNGKSITIPSLLPSHSYLNNNPIITSSSSNNSLIFTSQPKITAPLKNSNRKQFIPHRTHPINSSSNPPN
jgi:hypothetical protein